MEVIDMILMTLIVGFIFTSLFEKFSNDRMKGFLYSVASVAPAIILHEFGHKFVAMGFGFIAEFNAAYTWLIIGLALKLLGGIVFFVPAYVSIGCIGDCVITPGASTLISFAGPAVNLLLYLIAKVALKVHSFSRTNTIILGATQKINGMLFLFNMLPVPMFDGFSVYSGLYHLIFG